MKTDADILIIGAGASGMAAALEAERVRPGSRIVLLERADRPGKKLLTTGNGRCNLSNSETGLSCYNPGAERFSSVLERYGDDRGFFRSLGLLTKEDREGRIYPLSGQASAVLDTLRFAVSDSGAEVICSAEVTQIEKEDGRFTVYVSDGRKFTADKVIIAAGSPAGAHGFGNERMITSLTGNGVPFRPFSPALVYLTVRDLPAQLKGVRAQAEVSLVCEDGKTFTETGEVQFADGYVSGICVMDLSRKLDEGSRAELVMDFCPGISREDIRDSIETAMETRGESPASAVLAGLVPKAVGEPILRSACSDIFRRKTASLTAGEIGAVTDLIKNYRLEVSGKGPFRSAQICTGGAGDADGSTMGSQACRGLYFCGEFVDVDGRCGGYNLHWAWASGRAAGAAAAVALKEP